MDDGKFHNDCFACGVGNVHGLRLRFSHAGNSVTGAAVIDPRFQSYTGVAHGGIVAAVLDAAMVRCLQTIYGENPFTVRLEMRYIESTPIGRTLKIIASAKNRRGAMCWAEASLEADGAICAKARGVFSMKK